MGQFECIGFIGLGVMGEPMCRNIAAKSGASVRAYDVDPAPMARLEARGVRPAEGAAEIARECDLVLLSLPSGAEVEALCVGDGGLAQQLGAGQVLLDLGTSPPALARWLDRTLADKGALFADAPVARTRQAAEAGTLSIMVGAAPDLFERLRPVLACCGSEVTHCGDVGAGQVVKVLNNMVLCQTVGALSEAVAIATAQGVDPALLFDALSKGSADSFALRNHGMKSILPGAFPERAFSTQYMLKDVAYALEMAGEGRLEAQGVELARERLEAAIAAGHGTAYWPVIATLLGKPAVH